MPHATGSPGTSHVFQSTSARISDKHQSFAGSYSTYG